MSDGLSHDLLQHSPPVINIEICASVHDEVTINRVVIVLILAKCCLVCQIRAAVFLRTGWSSGGDYDHLVLGVDYADKSLCRCMEVIHMLIIGQVM